MRIPALRAKRFSSPVSLPLCLGSFSTPRPSFLLGYWGQFSLVRRSPRDQRALVAVIDGVFFFFFSEPLVNDLLDSSPFLLYVKASTDSPRKLTVCSDIFFDTGWFRVSPPLR